MTTPDYSQGAAYIDGQFVPINEARISVLDWGFTRSDTVYDVVSTVDGAFFRLPQHLDRFAHSMAQRRLDVGMTQEQIRENLHTVVALTGLRDAYVAMVALRGRPRVLGSRRPQDCGNHLVTYAIPWIDVIPKPVQERGAKLLVADVPRVPDASVDPTVKNYQWSDLTTGLLQADENGFDTAVLCDAQGYVTEGPGFNVFVVRGGRVMTSDHGVLHGITRRTVLELCAAFNIPAGAQLLPRADLENADEVFLATTAGGLMPIRQVNQRMLPHTDGGPIFNQLNKAFWDMHRDPQYSEPVRYELARFA